MLRLKEAEFEINFFEIVTNLEKNASYICLWPNTKQKPFQDKRARDDEV